MKLEFEAEVYEDSVRGMAWLIYGAPISLVTIAIVIALFGRALGVAVVFFIHCLIVFLAFVVIVPIGAKRLLRKTVIAISFDGDAQEMRLVFWEGDHPLIIPYESLDLVVRFDSMTYAKEIQMDRYLFQG